MTPFTMQTQIRSSHCSCPWGQCKHLQKSTLQTRLVPSTRKLAQLDLAGESEISIHQAKARHAAMLTADDVPTAFQASLLGCCVYSHPLLLTLHEKHMGGTTTRHSHLLKHYITCQHMPAHAAKLGCKASAQVQAHKLARYALSCRFNSSIDSQLSRYASPPTDPAPVPSATPPAMPITACTLDTASSL